LSAEETPATLLDVRVREVLLALKLFADCISQVLSAVVLRERGWQRQR
jgi:hypothetical protein